MQQNFSSLDADNVESLAPWHNSVAAELPNKWNNVQKAYLYSRCLDLRVVVVCDQERLFRGMPACWSDILSECVCVSLDK